MIILAPGTGNLPTPSISSGTPLSQWSSWRVRVSSSSEYHDPACEASLEAMMSLLIREEGQLRRGQFITVAVSDSKREDGEHKEVG